MALELCVEFIRLTGNAIPSKKLWLQKNIYTYIYVSSQFGRVRYLYEPFVTEIRETIFNDVWR